MAVKVGLIKEADFGGNLSCRDASDKQGFGAQNPCSSQEGMRCQPGLGAEHPQKVASAETCETSQMMQGDILLIAFRHYLARPPDSGAFSRRSFLSQSSPVPIHQGFKEAEKTRLPLQKRSRFILQRLMQGKETGGEFVVKQQSIRKVWFGIGRVGMLPESLRHQ